jgi:hypothetical protein
MPAAGPSIPSPRNNLRRASSGASASKAQGLHPRRFQRAPKIHVRFKVREIAVACRSLSGAGSELTEGVAGVVPAGRLLSWPNIHGQEEE